MPILWKMLDTETQELLKAMMPKRWRSPQDKEPIEVELTPEFQEIDRLMRERPRDAD